MIIRNNSSVVKQDGEICTDQPTYERCPGCFDWTTEDTAVLFSPGELDDHKAYRLCQRCTTIVDNADIARHDVVQRIFKNIGVYAGWSNK